DIAGFLADGSGGEDPTAPLQYADAAEALQEWLGAEDGPGAAFWRQQDLPALGLPGPQEPAVPETVSRRLPAAPVAGLAGRLGVPVPLLLLGVWNAALWWETGEERRPVAVAVDGRTLAELAGTVGRYTRSRPAL